MGRQMFSRTLGVLAVASAMAAAGAAQAKTVRIAKTVPAGQSSKIDHYTGWNNDCSFLRIDVDVTAQPANGHVAPRVASSRITRGQVGTADHCIGKPTKVVEVYYTPKAGFRGSDGFTIDMRSQGNETVTFVYSITVR